MGKTEHLHLVATLGRRQKDERRKVRKGGWTSSWKKALTAF